MTSDNNYWIEVAQTGNRWCSICSKNNYNLSSLCKYSAVLLCMWRNNQWWHCTENRLSVTVNAARFVLLANFHYAEVEECPMSHAEHSELNMKAESDASGNSQLSNDATQKAGSGGELKQPGWRKKEGLDLWKCNWTETLCELYWAYCNILLWHPAAHLEFL